MKLLLDMNLSPQWVRVLADHGWQAVHWSDVGDAAATDRTIMEWAREHDCVLVTHDLDFGALLAATPSQKPSVIQVRAQDIMPGALAPILIDALERFQKDLERGALVVVDPMKARVRILPIGPAPPE